MAKEKGPRGPMGGLGSDEVGDGEAAIGHDVDVLAGKIERIEEGGEGIVGGEVHTAGDGGVDGGEHFDVAAVYGLHGGIKRCQPAMVNAARRSASRVPRSSEWIQSKKSGAPPPSGHSAKKTMVPPGFSAWAAFNRLLTA